MRKILIGLALVTAIFALTRAAISNEDEFTLKPGAGLDLVQANCIACHSLDYPVMNAPFLDKKGWTGVVTKMVKVFGAPIEEADQTQIIDYLVANYGKL